MLGFNHVYASAVSAPDWGWNLIFFDLIATYPTVCVYDTDCRPSHNCTADISALFKPCFAFLPSPGEVKPCNHTPRSEVFGILECKLGLLPIEEEVIR